MDVRVVEINKALQNLNWGNADFIRELKRAFPQHADISDSTFYRILDGSAVERRRRWLNDGLAVVRKSLKNFSTEQENDDISIHMSSNMTDQDSALQRRADELTRIVNIKAILVNPGLEWSAKKETHMVRIGSAFPGAAGLPIQLEEKLGNIYAGSVLVFRPVVTIYPRENVLLLFESYNNPDRRLIGWIDPNISGIKIQTSGQSQDLTEWKPTHFAFALMMGHDKVLTSTRTEANGISPWINL